MTEKPTYEELEKKIQELKIAESKHKQAEEALLERETLFTNITSNVPGMLYQFMMKPDGTYSVPYSSASIIDMFGCSLEEVRNTFDPIIKAIFPEDQNRIIQTINESAKNMSPWNCEYRVQLPDQGVKWVLGHSIPVKMADGSIVWSGYNKDVTERKKAEEALRKSEAIKNTMVSNIGDVIVIIDQNGINQYKSPNITKLFGWKPEELVGQSTWDNVHPDDLEHGKNFIGSLLEEPNKTGTTEVRYKRKDGSYCYIQFTAVNLFHDPDINGILGNYHDITNRKKMEKNIQQSQKMESIGTLAGGIAHDFNNLLYVVMGNISLAQDGLSLELETSENLKTAQEACIKAKELSARLLTFSKGGDPLKKTMPVNGLLKDMVISVLSGSNITSEISIADDIRQVNIDEGQIKQVVQNIVVNAKESMGDNGQLTVSCKNIDIAEESNLPLIPGEYIKISFEDHGCGISKENLEKIFDPYFSIKDMGADKGQGLGLTICYSIIRKHGGLIHVESEPQTGSTFSVYLPAFLVKESDLQKSEEKHRVQKPVKQPATGTGKILLMDDEKAIRAFLGKVINRLGYDVETCIEGKEAVEIYTKAMESKEPFDVVILDLTNKIGMGGQATMKKLLEINPDVKGIIITGYSDDPVVANFEAYGFSGVIIKPATKDELSKVINEVLS